MDENKKDDFWQSSNDDFWKKPVVSDDWLNKDSNDNPYLRNESDGQIRNQKMPQQSTQPEEMQSQPAARQSTQPELTQQRQTVLNGQVLREPKAKKPIHIHTIMCLFYIALAIISVVTAVASYSMAKKKAVEAGKELFYKETEVSNTFMYDKYNEVTIGKVAEVVCSGENFTGFPEGQMLISVLIEVKSEEYVSGADVLEDVYIGYDVDGHRFYESIPPEDWVYAYVAGNGISKREIMDAYGMGNGTDDSQYAYFFVPAEVEEVTLYMPKTGKKKHVNVIDTIHYITLQVATAD